MNRMMKTWIAILLTLAMLPALCACGGKTAKIPEAVMLAAEEQLRRVDSVTFDMNIQMVLEAQGETMDLGMTMQAETIKEPVAVRCNTHIGMLGVDTEVYLLQQDGAYVTYTAVKDGEGKTSWYKMALNQSELQEQVDSYDADSFFGTQLSVAKELKLIGKETVAGKSAVRYDGVIPPDAMGEALDASGAGDTLELLGIDPSEITEGLPISIWIYEDGLPAKYEFDMTEMLSQLLAKNESTAQIVFTAMGASMTITGVNNVQEIVLPDEALDAQELNPDDIINNTDEGEGLDLPWHEAAMGDAITLSDGTELAVSGIAVDDGAGTIRVDAGLADPAKAPLAALLCANGEGEYQLEQYTVDEAGSYVFYTEGYKDLSVYAVIFVDGSVEDGEIWYVDTRRPASPDRK